LFFKRGKNHKHFETTYLSLYLNKMKQMIKQFEDSIIQKKSDKIMDEEALF
jgi:hypothetical protein